MNEPLAEFAKEQIDAHGLQEHAFAFVIIALLGFALGWLANMFKTRSEINKLKAEIRTAKGTHLEKLAELRERSNSKRETLNLAMQTMRDAIQDKNKTMEQLRAHRDEMCNLYEVEYVPSVQTYLEMIPALVDKTECWQRARSELIPGLQTTCNFLNMVNMKAMLEKVNGSHFLIRPEVRDCFLDRVYALIPLWRIKERRQLASIRKQTDKHLRTMSDVQQSFR